MRGQFSAMAQGEQTDTMVNKKIFMSRPGVFCAAGRSLPGLWKSVSSAHRDSIVPVQTAAGKSFYAAHIPDDWLEASGARYDMRIIRIEKKALDQIEKTIQYVKARYGQDRVAVCAGSCDNGSEFSVAAHRSYFSSGVFPLSYELEMQGAGYVASYIQERFGLGGPALAFSTACSSSASAAVKAAELIRAGIPVITHVILGLPGESEEEMLETVRHVNGVYERASGENGHILSGCGIKLQLLHYLGGTELGRRYLVFHKESVRKDLAGELKARSLARDGEPVRKDLAGELKTCSLNWNGEPGLTDEPPAAGHAAGNVTDGDRALRAMTEEEYVRTVADCISVLHPDIVVHRLTGDGNSRILLAPLWSRNKRHVLNSIRHELSSRGIVQGCGRS